MYTALHCTTFKKVRRKEQSSGGNYHNILKEMTNTFKTSQDFSPKFFLELFRSLFPFVRIMIFFPCCCLLFNLSGGQACPACVGSAPAPLQVLRQRPPAIQSSGLFQEGWKASLTSKNGTGNTQKQTHGFLGKVGQIWTITGLSKKVQGLPQHHLRNYQTGVKHQAEQGTHGHVGTHAHGRDGAACTGCAEDTATNALTSLITE